MKKIEISKNRKEGMKEKTEESFVKNELFTKTPEKSKMRKRENSHIISSHVKGKTNLSKLDHSMNSKDCMNTSNLNLRKERKKNSIVEQILGDDDKTTKIIEKDLKEKISGLTKENELLKQEKSKLSDQIEIFKDTLNSKDSEITVLNTRLINLVFLY